MKWHNLIWFALIKLDDKIKQVKMRWFGMIWYGKTWFDLIG